jgi:hypothetical protein
VLGIGVRLSSFRRSFWVLRIVDDILPAVSQDVNVEYLADRLRRHVTTTMNV